jgi:hypothetical protein
MALCQIHTRPEYLAQRDQVGGGAVVQGRSVALHFAGLADSWKARRIVSSSAERTRSISFVPRVRESRSQSGVLWLVIISIAEMMC